MAKRIVISIFLMEQELLMDQESPFTDSLLLYYDTIFIFGKKGIGVKAYHQAIFEKRRFESRRTLSLRAKRSNLSL